MAKFDLHHLRDGAALVLDCPADLPDRSNTRFVVPLMAPDAAPPPAARLNPVLDVEGQPVVMVTHLAGAVPVKELGEGVCSLGGARATIGGALDMPVGGFCGG